MAELVLSASSVTTFLRCGQQWYLLYVEGIRQAPRLKAVRGIAVHRAVEVDMTQKITSYEDLPVEDMLDAYDESWTQETDSGFEKDPNESAGSIKDAGYGLIKLYREKVAPRIQPEIVELPVQFKINGQAYSGQIDLGHRVFNPETLESKMVIRDTKTTARMPQEGQYLLNMTGYAISQRQATGEEEADTVLDYLIANKEPKYKELRMGGPITEADIRRFSRVVGSVAASINSEQYVPNGLTNGACSWCGVSAYCPSYLKVNTR